MSYKTFATIMFGIFLVGTSVGYVFGFYVHKYLNYNYMFYISALIMGVGCFLLIYGALFIKKKNDGN